MNILALDTSTPALTVALQAGQKTHVKHRDNDSKHSRDVLTVIDTLFAKAGLVPSNLDAVAFGQGPGAFTGVRLGVAIAQGLGLALNLPLVPVSSLAIVAQGCLSNTGTGSVSVAQDARMGEVYAARFESRNNLATLLGRERVLAPTALAPPAEDSLGGDAWARIECLQAIGEARGVARIRPHAADLIALAAAALARGQTVRADAADAHYLRASVVS